MMMDSAREEKPLGIDSELRELRTVPVTWIIIENCFDDMPDRQVPLAILIPGDVAACLGGFRQMECIFFLPKRQGIPSWHFKAHYLDVGKFVYDGLHDVKIDIFRNYSYICRTR